MSPSLFATLWREVCRQPDIEAATRAVFHTLQASFRVDGVLVRQWDEVRSQLTTVAAAGAGAGVLGARSVAPTPRKAELLAWAAADRAEAWAGREQTAIARFVVPDSVAGPVAAGPLHEDGGLLGVLVRGGPIAAADAEPLLEAFSHALAQDARVHELARLREAAESDRAALLSRLDRQDVSEAIVGAEAGLREVMLRVGQVAPTDAPVLILGETGAGKEVVARAIHERSRRAKGPFLRVNCGAIPAELVDSELFGHERGAFTGAIHQRKGWFERADGGTLFLDEIGELPAAAQVRLLRVLQDGSFERVGGHAPHTADVRIVAATHRDMPVLVRAGAFREDLWYRVSVFPLVLPALRERRGDIPALARHFAARAGQRLFGRALPIDSADLASLIAYDWPGNVRELAAVIERAAILGGGRGLEIVVALGVGSGVRGGAWEEGPSASTSDRMRGAEPGQERQQIEAALARCHGRIEGRFGAALALGVNPHTLRSRMRRLGIDWGRFRA